MHPVNTIALLGLPYDLNSSFLNGPRLAPCRIREMLKSEHWNNTTENGVDLDEHSVHDFGDLQFPAGDRALDYQHIERSVTDILHAGYRLLSLGGDHSVSFPVISAYAKKYEGLNILHIDAHSDLYENFEGNFYSHASPFARLMETGLINRLVQVGIRTLNRHQKEQASRLGVEIIQMKDWKDDFKLSISGPVYISLDLDALDPAFAPGVSHHEPGGFTTRQVINLLHGFTGNVVGADVVELNPLRDAAGLTATVAAKLVRELKARLIIDSGHMLPGQI